MRMLIESVKESAEAKKSTDGLPEMENVIDITIEEKTKSFKEAAIECNAISLESFDQKFEEAINEAYRG